MHVSDLADEMGLSTVVVVSTCQSLGIDARWAGAEISDDDAERIRAAVPTAGADGPPPFGSVATPHQAWLGHGSDAATPPSGAGPVGSPPTPPSFAPPVPPPPTGPATVPASFGSTPAGAPPIGTPPSFGSAPAGTPPIATPPSFGSTPAGTPPIGTPPSFGWTPAGAVPAETPSSLGPTADGPVPADAAAVTSARLAAVGTGSGGTGWLATPPATDPPLRAGQHGHRDAMVASGWGYWWRSIGVAVGTVVVVIFVALVLGDVAVIGDAYSQHAVASRGKVALVVALMLGGLAWAAVLQVRGAISSLDAWNRIGHSGGALRGRGSTTFLVFSAVVSCTNLAWFLVGGIWAIAIV